MNVSACEVKDGAIDAMAAVCAADSAAATEADKSSRTKWAKTFNIREFKEAVAERRGQIIIMEAAGINADNIKQLLNSPGSRPYLSLNVVLNAALPLFTGVHKLSAAGLAHLDMKPLNIVISGQEPPIQLKFIDFGAASTYKQFQDGKLPVRDVAYMYDPPEIAWSSWLYKIMTMLKEGERAGTKTTFPRLSIYEYAQSQCTWIHSRILNHLDLEGKIPRLPKDVCSNVIMALLNVPRAAWSLKVHTFAEIKAACENNQLINLAIGTPELLRTTLERTLSDMRERAFDHEHVSWRAWSRALVMSVPMEPTYLNAYGLGLCLAEIACVMLDAYSLQKTPVSAEELDAFYCLMQICGAMMHLVPEKRAAVELAQSELARFLGIVTDFQLFRKELNRPLRPAKELKRASIQTRAELARASLHTTEEPKRPTLPTTKEQETKAPVRKKAQPLIRVHRTRAAARK